MDQEKNRIKKVRILKFAVILIAVGITLTATTHAALQEPKPFKNSVLIIPPLADRTLPPEQAKLGFAVKNLLENTLALHDRLEENWFLWHLQDIFPEADDFAAWLNGNNPVPETAGKIRIRYLLSGRISRSQQQYIVRFNLTDQSTHQTMNRDIPLDIPGLIKFRIEFIDFLSHIGIGKPGKRQMARMHWKENISVDSFARLGEGIYNDLLTTGYPKKGTAYETRDLEEGLQHSPDSYLLLNSFAWVVYRQKKYAEAKMIFERALRVNPDGLDSTDGMIQCESSTDNDAQAERWVNRKAEIQGHDLRNAQAAFWNLRGNAANDKQDYEKAIINYRKAINLNPGPVVYLTNLALTYRDKREFKEALGLLESALQKATDTENREQIQKAIAKVHLSWGRFYRDKRAFEDAKVQIQAAFEIDKRINRSAAAEELAYLGLIYKQLDQQPEALKFFERARAITQELNDLSQEAVMLSLIGKTYSDLNQQDLRIASHQSALEKAIQAKNEALQIDMLNNLGNALSVNKQAEKSIKFLEQALALSRKLQKDASIANSLFNLAFAYKQADQSGKAVELYQQALALFRKLNDQTQVHFTLTLLAMVHRSLNKYDESVKLWEQALTLARQLNDRDNLAFDAKELGVVYGLMKRFDEGQNSLEMAARLAAETKNRTLERDAYHEIGKLLWSLREFNSKQATESLNLNVIRYHEKSLAISREVHDRDQERDTLTRLIWPLLDLQEYAKAETYATKALALSRELKNRLGEALALTALGAINMKFSTKMDIALLQDSGDRNYLKAIEYYEQALPILHELNERSDERSVLEYIGAAYFFSAQYAKGVRAFEQTLLLARQLNDKDREATSLNNLMYAWRQLNNPQLAIFYGKQAVNTKQEIRGNLLNIRKEFQAGFLEQNERTYRYLADLLIQQGRLPEAQQVLGLLKEEEYFDFVRRDSKDAASLQGRSEYTRKEADWEKRYAEISGKLTAMGVEYNQLLGKISLNADEMKRRDELQRDLVIGNQAFQSFLDQLAKDLGRSETEKVIPEVSKSLRRTLKDLGANSVALYTLVTDEKYVVIVVTPRVEVAREYKIAAADLNRLILDFRETIQNPNFDPRPLGKKLYDVLIAPVATDLEGANAETLMWSLDGILRYVPMAALFDGEHFMVERYRNVVITLASMDSLKEQPRANWTGLGLGVSKPHSGFAPLKAVPEELKEIIREPNANGSTRGILPGEVMLDEAFTKESMESGLRQHPAMVHIASHFKFQPGNEADSYLLLGNGNHLSLAEINTAVDLFEGVDLLTLSACDTAMSGAGANGKEVERFGVLAQRQGAKAVMASLWPVADRSTKEFMKNFYQIREARPGTLKAEALRQAQLRLLLGKTNSHQPSSFKRGPISESPDRIKSMPFNKNPDMPFAHPYYWAPFILIGNWR
jgi:CHAT domain-containing protein/tetratricopeptide (TPR) repeat protein